MSQPVPPAASSPAPSPFLSRGRCWLLGLMLAGAALFAGLVWARGYTRAWDAWGFVPAGEPFLDLRVITAGAESRRQGFDPLYENPRDPMQRRMNYPRLWQSLSSCGITQQHTVPLGASIAAAFLAAVATFPRRLGTGGALALGAALFSPAVVLCLERGNIDLVLFAVEALALFALRRSAVAATGVLLAGFALKLYPILGLVALLRESRRRFLFLTAGAAVAVAAYLVLYQADVHAIRAATPSSVWLSYGLVTAARALTDHLTAAPAGVLPGAQTLGIGLLLSLLVAVGWRVGRPAPAAEPATTPNLDAFRLGAGIYAGTFLLGSNFDYRLVFLLFTLPQLADWARDAAPDRRRVAILTLAAIQVALWQLLWKPWLTPAADASWWALALPTLFEQAAKVATFAGVAYLLAATAPAWLGEWFAPRHARVSAGVRRLRGSTFLCVVLLVIAAGLGLQTVRVANDWGHFLAPVGGQRAQRDALLAQALFSGDGSHAAALRARDSSLHPQATIIGSVARLTSLPAEQAAGLVLVICLAAALTAGWLFAQRLGASPEGQALIFAAAVWCPALGASTPAWRLESFVVALGVWAAWLTVRGYERRGAVRPCLWAGALAVGALPLWEAIVRAPAAAALGWMALSLLVGWAAAQLLASSWPRPVVAPAAVLLPVFPALILGLLPLGTVRRAPVAPPGLVEALRALVPPQALCVVAGSDALQTLPLVVERRSSIWDLPAGADPKPRIAELEQMLVGALIVPNNVILDPAQLAALTARLNLDPAPTFAHPAAAVYLSHFLRGPALARLGQVPAFENVEATAGTEGGQWPATPRIVPPGAAAFAFPMVRPRPSHYNLAFGYERWSVDGTDVLRANAESEIFVPVPPAARQILWEFGILNSAYPSTGGTDGVEFLIWGESPDGDRRELLRRVLDPARREGDRGLQRTTTTFVPRPGERLVFQSMAHGSGAYDWSYWRRIDVR